jgi:hypothetical protein
MTARDIQNYMIRNGACPSDIYCDVVNGIVYFDTREVPAKAYAAMPVVFQDKFLASIAQPQGIT